jgi:SecD/SecF fusion protein
MMDKNKLWKVIALVFAVLASLTLVWPPFDQRNEDGDVIRKGKIVLGLDLKGGSSFVLEVDQQDVKAKMADADPKKGVNDIGSMELAAQVKRVQEIAVEVIRNRIDALGTAEPEIYPEGDKRIMVRIPGADAETREEAKAMLLQDAVLTFKLVHKESDEWVNELIASGVSPYGYTLIPSAGYYIRDLSVADEKLNRETRTRMKRLGGKPADFMFEKDKLRDGSTVYRPVYVSKRRELGGDTIENAYVSQNPTTGRREIVLEFDKVGAKVFGQITTKYAPRGSSNADSDLGRRLAVILDDQLYSSPTINEPILGGRATISGVFSAEEAARLAKALRAGALPGRVVIAEERTVDPTLGADSVKSGRNAIVLGAVAVLIFMGCYYLLPGLIANVSLLFVFILLPLGMVFSSGMLGALSGALEGGAVSLPVITLYGIAGIVLTLGMAVDANVLIFERMREEVNVGKSVSAAINAGYNKAFSTILDANVTTLLTAAILFWQGSGPIRGFAVTLCAGILVSMFIVLVITRLIFNAMADANMLKSLKMLQLPGLATMRFDFVGKRKFAAILSVALIVGSWVYFGFKGDSNLGVDFRGGTVMIFDFDAGAQQDIDVVRTKLAEAGFGTASVAYQKKLSGEALLEVKVAETDDAANGAVEAIRSLEGNYKVIQNDTVGPQVGSELKRQSLMAIICALIGIIIYISIRFEFAFAMGAIVALAHDVLITVGLYCALGRELSMPIVAALLTIVGYSVNDTIVVFDRIREDLKLEKGKSYKEIANLSINQTFSRTLLTSITTLLTVVMLMIFGGGSVNDFATALFIGIVVGTYSSIFVATPVVLMWHKEEKVK